MPAAYVAAVLELTGRTVSPEEVVSHYSAGPAIAILTALLRRSSTPDDLACYHRHLESRVAGISCYGGIDEALERLMALVPMAVFTGAGREAAELLLRQVGLRRYFPVLVTGDDISHPKPAPDGVIAACEALGVAAERAAYVGDAPNDLRAAKAAGVVAVAAAWGHEFDASVASDTVIHAPSHLARLLGGGDDENTT